MRRGVEGGSKWNGIAECGGRLYCAPYHAKEVLVIDPATGTTSTIPCGVEGGWKWPGIAECSGRLYCAPFNAKEVRVMDGGAV